MKCFVLLAAIAGLLVAPAPAAAIPNVKFCGHIKTWTISAGKNPPKYPRTSCAFAWASYRKLKRVVDQTGSLAIVFNIRVNGHRLRGTALPIGATLIVVMKNRRRYVQLTAPY